MPEPKPNPVVDKQELDEAVRDMLSVSPEELPEVPEPPKSSS